MSPRLRLLLLTIAAALVGAVCVFGGIRLAQQGEWGWGLGLAVAGGWTAFKSVHSYRAAVAPPRDPPAGPAGRGTRGR